jgi:hypothetical protein
LPFHFFSKNKAASKGGGVGVMGIEVRRFMKVTRLSARFLWSVEALDQGEESAAPGIEPGRLNLIGASSAAITARYHLCFLTKNRPLRNL